MFDAGFTELLLIGLIALLVVGPERLPKLAAEAGRWITRVRRFIANAKAEVESEFSNNELRDLLSQQEQEIRKLRTMMTDVEEDVKKELHETEDYLVRAVDEQTETPSQPESKPAQDKESREKESKEKESKPEHRMGLQGGESASSDDDEYERLTRQPLHRPFGDNKPASKTDQNDGNQ